MTETDRANLIEQFNSLIECLENEDVESALEWLRAAVRNLERQDLRQ